jgi:hypothetical protein
MLPFTIDTYTPDGVNVREEFTNHADSRPSLFILDDRIVKNRFFRGDRKTSGFVMVGMVTTVPGRNVGRKVGIGDGMGDTG